MCLIHAWGAVLISPCCASDESKDIYWRLISSSPRENSNGDAVRESRIASKHEMVIISVRRKYGRRSCEHNSSSAHCRERTEQDDQCIRRGVLPFGEEFLRVSQTTIWSRWWIQWRFLSLVSSDEKTKKNIIIWHIVLLSLDLTHLSFHFRSIQSRPILGRNTRK